MRRIMRNLNQNGSDGLTLTGARHTYNFYSNYDRLMVCYVLLRSNVTITYAILGY